MKHIILLLIIVCFGLCMKAQHNSDYIQYMFNGLLVNPAYAGSQEAMNITAMYRKQWLGLNGSPSDAMLTAHSPLKNKSVNLGFIVMNDCFGVYNHTNASLVYAYRVRLGKGKLALGLQAGFDSYSTNWNQIRTTDAGDPNFVPTASRQINPIAGTGVYYNTKNFYIGIAAPNLFNGQINPGTIINLTSGVVIKAGDDFRIKPALLIKRISGSPVEANLSSTFYYKDIIGLGVGYTYNSSAVAYIDIRLTEQLNFGYGYSYTLNELNAYSYGSHEIMLRYLFRYRINAVNARFF